MPSCSLRATSRPRHPRRARRRLRRRPARDSGWLRRSVDLRCARWLRVPAGDGRGCLRRGLHARVPGHRACSPRWSHCFQGSRVVSTPYPESATKAHGRRHVGPRTAPPGLPDNATKAAGQRHPAAGLRHPGRRKVSTRLPVSFVTQAPGCTGGLKPPELGAMMVRAGGHDGSSRETTVSRWLPVAFGVGD
jgi:hypothetical protein